jgi:hypothetical protein
VHPQRFARTNDYTPAGDIEPDDVIWSSGGDAQSAPLPDGEVTDTVMSADDAT